MPAEEDRLNAFRESRNVRIRTRTMSRLRLIIFAETKAHYLVSGKRNIPPTLMVERFAIIPGRTLRTVTYPPPRLATMGVKLSLPRLFTNTYIRVIDTHTYICICTRGKCTCIYNGALSTEYHFRGTS